MLKKLSPEDREGIMAQNFRKNKRSKSKLEKENDGYDQQKNQKKVEIDENEIETHNPVVTLPRDEEFYKN